MTAEEVIDAAEKVLAEEKYDVRKSHDYQQLCADTAYYKTIHQIKRIKQAYPLYLYRDEEEYQYLEVWVNYGKGEEKAEIQIDIRCKACYDTDYYCGYSSYEVEDVELEASPLLFKAFTVKPQEVKFKCREYDVTAVGRKYQE